jgi:hypothetical protein
VGRHSIPDPDDAADESDGGRGDFTVPSPEPGYGDDQYADDQYGDDQYGDEYADADEQYADEDYPESNPRGIAVPSQATTVSGPAHSGDWEGGEWTGSHRAVTAGRRGVSMSIIVALVAVVVLVGGVIVWRFFGDALSSRSDAAAARCVDGDLNVAVLADPTIADQIQTLAKSYNDSADPVGDRCVKIGVKPAESDQVLAGFTGDWPGDLGERPALWVPASGVSEARLEGAKGAQTVSDSRSLVTSPVVLAVRPELKDALGQQNWSTLPGLQTNPAGLDGLNLPGWGGLKLALPLTGDADASYLAAEAVAAASAPAGQPASAGVGAVNTLMAGAPELPDKSAKAAMDALLDASDPATAPVHAVATTEQQLFQRGAALPDAKSTVASWLPPGPTATADYPTVLLAGDWLSQEQVAAASEFARFMRKPEHLSELAKAGFRTDGATPPASDVTNFAPVSAPLAVGDKAMRTTLADALTSPTQAAAATIMLDESMTADEGGKSRLANTTAALNARLRALPPNAAVGLWTFNGTAGTSQITAGPLSDPVGDQPRSAALASTLDGLSASGGGAVSFTTLRLVYNEALSNFRQGQPNSVLVITEGPHTDQTLGGDGLQAFVRDAVDPARPVAVNVIDFGADPDQSTWQSVAQITGGTYQNVDSSTSPDLTAAITKMLG